MPRVIAFLMVSAAGAVQAQQPPPAATQPTPPTVTKADSADKVTCRVHMEGNLPRRVCMPNSQWKKIDSQDNNGSNETYNNNYRCTVGPVGAC